MQATENTEIKTVQQTHNANLSIKHIKYLSLFPFDIFSGIIRAHSRHDNRFDSAEWDEDHTHVFALPTVFEEFEGPEHRPRIIITTTSEDPVDIKVNVGKINYEHVAKVTRSRQVEIPLPTEARLADPGVVSDKTVLVKSSAPISVHCIDNEYESGDGFLAQPNSQLGNQFYVMSYAPFWHETHYNPGFFCISAIEDDTLVEIDVLETGQRTQVPLQAYQSYRSQGGYFEDLTGTVIRSNKPISVVSGIFTRVPHGAPKGADGLLEQIPSVESWGTKYVLGPFLGRASGYVYRVLAGPKPSVLTVTTYQSKENNRRAATSTNNTQILDATVDNNNNPKVMLDQMEKTSINLAADKWYESGVENDAIIAIESDQPVLVFQFMKSNQEGDIYEPSMMMVPSTDSFDNTLVTFPVFNCTFVNDFKYNIHVTIDCADANNLMFDDTSMARWQRLQTAENGMCFVRGRVTIGVHSISHPDPDAKFTVAVYGLHKVSSYAYPAGYKPSGKIFLFINLKDISQSDY